MHDTIRTSPERRAPTGVWPFVAFTGIVFGSGGLIAKGLVDDGVDPFTVTSFPFLAGGVLGLLVGARLGHARRTALGPAVLLGLTASAAPALLFNIGFESLSAGIVTLLISLGPVFTAVVAHWTFPDERFNRTKAIGLVLALAGVTVLSLGAVDGDATVGAITAVVVGSLAAGGAAVLARKFTLVHGATALIAPQLTTAGVVALALTPVAGREVSPPQGFETWHLVAMGLFGLTTYLGFLSMLKANEVGTTGQVSVIGYCVPLFGVVGGVAIFDDAITGSLVVGGLLIVVAVGAIAAGSKSTGGAVEATVPD